MLIRPHTMSLITTHQCTAACDHCCFTCSPQINKAIPFERMVSLIEEAAQSPSIRIVVFTGGECFLLGDRLNTLVEHATRLGLRTRCVSNGYWATSRDAAIKRIDGLAAAGLKELNLSTGSFHSQYVPVSRIVHAAYAAVNAGLLTVVNAEIYAESDFDIEQLTRHPDIADLCRTKRLVVQRNVWIENGGQANLTHAPESSRFREGNQAGCVTAMNVLAVTPDQSLVACCGLHLEHIPELHLGSVADRTIQEVIESTPDDFLKIWIHVQGPERILEFVKEHLPDYELPLSSPHPCQTCLHLYKDERAKAIIRENYHKVEAEITTLYMAGVTANSMVQSRIQTGEQ